MVRTSSATLLSELMKMSVTEMCTSHLIKNSRSSQPLFLDFLPGRLSICRSLASNVWMHCKDIQIIFKQTHVYFINLIRCGRPDLLKLHLQLLSNDEHAFLTSKTLPVLKNPAFFSWLSAKRMFSVTVPSFFSNTTFSPPRDGSGDNEQLARSFRASSIRLGFLPTNGMFCSTLSVFIELLAICRRLS